METVARVKELAGQRELTMYQLAEQYEQNLAKRRGEIEVAKETGVEK